MNRNKNSIIATLARGYTARVATHENEEHLVAPVTILTEGVHCGSGGCKLYTADVLSQLPEAWNGRPLPIFHPEDPDGMAVSANTPALLQERSVGILFNIRYDRIKRALRGEIWLNVRKAEEISPEALAMVRGGQPLEVSTGLWSHDLEGEGEWNGEHFDATVETMFPDHLALLPGGTGACSQDDGCGLRTNKEGNVAISKEMIALIAKEKGIKANTDFTVDEKSYERLKEIVENELSHEDIRQRLQVMMDDMDNPVEIHWVVAVFEDEFIFRKQIRKESGTENKLFKQAYSVDASDNIQLADETAEVKQETTFVELTAVKKEVKNMANKCCPEKVKTLIDNERSVFAEKDKDWLEGLSEENLATLEAGVPAEAPSSDEKDTEIAALKEEAETNKAKIKTLEGDGETQTAPRSFEDIMKTAPDSLKENLQYAEDLRLNEKKSLVDGILKANEGVWSREELEAKGLPELNKLAKATKVQDFSGQAGSHQPVENEEDDVMEVPDTLGIGQKKD